MAALTYLKRSLDSSLYRKNVVCDLGTAFRVCSRNARAFSSVETAKACNRRNHDELKLERIRSFLNEHGFTPEQVTRVSKYLPLAYSKKVERLSLKLSFLESILGSDDDVAKVVAENPVLLSSSLENKLIPNYTFIKSILGCDELVAKSMKRSSRILHMNVKGNLAAKVDFLKESGVPSTSIAKLMEHAPGVFGMPFSKIKDSLEKAMAFGFDPSNPMIVSAVRAICQLTASVWERKVEVYRRWGWSSDDVGLAFKKHPFVMSLSEKKINKAMDAYLNTFGLSSSDIALRPSMMFLSVEERIIPRGSVLALLGSKGILGHKHLKASTYASALKLREEAFVERYVDKYPEHVLELWLKLRRKDVV